VLANGSGGIVQLAVPGREGLVQVIEKPHIRVVVSDAASPTATLMYGQAGNQLTASRLLHNGKREHLQQERRCCTG
jgi:archaeosine-15-forming tRNA-guanine transglycosylase